MNIELPIPLNNDLEKRISEAFCIFDHHGDKTIDIREVGTVLRFLGCVPTLHDCKEIVAATENEDGGEVSLIKFLPHVSQLIMEGKMHPATPEQLLAAFKVLDPENRNYLTKDYMCKLMEEQGEPLNDEEMEDMLAVAIDPITGRIPYEYYLNQLTHSPKDSIYHLAEALHQKHLFEKTAKTRQSKVTIVAPPKSTEEHEGDH